MTISVWVSLRNVSFVFKVFLLRNGQNLYFRISGLHFFNFCSLFGELMFTLFMNSYTWNHIHESVITKFFAIQILCLSGCVARIADFGSSEPGTKSGERSISLQYANTTYTLWIICFKSGSLRGSISRPFDLKSNALPLRHRGKKIFGKKNLGLYTSYFFEGVVIITLC